MMQAHLLIETRTTWDSGEVTAFLRLAQGLARSGEAVDLFLIQNGTLLAQAGVEPLVEELQREPGVTVWVDDFSLASRLPGGQDLIDRANVAGMQKLVDLLVRPDCRVVWH